MTTCLTVWYIDSMIIKQIPSTYKLTINAGLDEAMDELELRNILDRNPDLRKAVVDFDTEMKSTKHLKRLAKKLEGEVYPNNLLDRAYSAVRSKPDPLKDRLSGAGFNQRSIEYLDEQRQARCKHEDWDLQMDNSGRTWSVCNLCGVEGD